MHIRLKRVLLCGLLLAVLLGVFCFSVSAFNYEGSIYDVDLSTYSINIGGTQLPLSKYPDGSVTPFSTYDSAYLTVSEARQYGIYLSNDLWLRSAECMAFARYVYAALYYKYPATATMDTFIAAEINPYKPYAYIDVLTTPLEGGTYSASDVEQLFKSCYPGSFIRQGGHSMVIMSIFDDGVIVYDANGMGNYNEVDIRKYSWQGYVNSYGSRAIYALQIPSYYPGYTDSLGRSGGGAYDFEMDTSEAGTYRVNVSTTLNVRSGPGTYYSIVGSLAGGTEVEVLGTSNGWACIDYNGAACWLSMNYLDLVKLALKIDGYQVDTSDAGEYEVYNCTYVNVRSGPGTNFSRIDRIPAGSRVTVLGTYGYWAAVTYDSTEAWISMDYLTPYKKRLVVNFEASGGVIDYDKDQYVVGEPFGSLPGGTKTDRGLMGWFYNGKEYTENTLVPDVSQLTLTAKWHVLNFSDVSETIWYSTYVERGFYLGIIADDNKFYPDRNAKRGEFVTVLSRIYAKETGEDISLYSSEVFTDVGQNRYYAAPIGWAYANGIVSGMTSTEFWPESEITREQIATILYRYAKFVGATGDYDGPVHIASFYDGDQVSNFAKTAINWAVENEILKGDTAGNLNPKNPAKRSEMVTLAVRLLEYIAKNQ